MIPHQNIRNLMLREDVVKAVQDKQFHIYAVKTIDEGIKVLTGTPTGERQEDGTYPEGTVNHLIDRQLREYAQKLKGYHISEAEAV
jgi:predicted ATP-dependent protease